MGKRKNNRKRQHQQDGNEIDDRDRPGAKKWSRGMMGDDEKCNKLYEKYYKVRARCTFIINYKQ
jgi:hypothetical protein